MGAESKKYSPRAPIREGSRNAVEGANFTCEIYTPLTYRRSLQALLKITISI